MWGKMLMKQISKSVSVDIETWRLFCYSLASRFAAESNWFDIMTWIYKEEIVLKIWILCL